MAIDPWLEIDRLRARVATLERERNGLDYETVQIYEAEVARLTRVNGALHDAIRESEAENARLRAAIARYLGDRCCIHALDAALTGGKDTP